jgi:taurine dioxygenase
MTIAIRPLTNVIGAEVFGVDLREDLATDTVAGIRDAWHEHKVLFFPGQSIDRAQHKRFATYFGDLWQHPFLKDVHDDGDFVELYSGGDTGRAFLAENWHTDVTFAECPPMGSVLRALEVPEFGGDTMWLDLEAAFDALSPTMQEFATRLVAVHSAPRRFFVPSDTTGEEIVNKHPVVRTHADTGRRCLFVNPGFTKHIDGLKPKESEALLSFFHRHCQQPEFMVRYHWTAGTIGMWDNRCTQHKVVADNRPALRKMERLTLAGDRPA